MTGIVVNREVDVAKICNYFLTAPVNPIWVWGIKSKAMNTNQNDPTCCTTGSGCCGITDMGCC